jgi:hypothetical protein
MLPKKMLLQPILGGEPKATDRAEESSDRNRTRSILRSLQAATSSWMVSSFSLLKGNFF